MGKEVVGMSFEHLDIILIGVAILGVGILVSLLRLFLGPTSPDRVVALDTINTLVVGMMIGLGAYYEEVVFIDIGIVYAILSFVTTLFIARFISTRKEKEVGP
ncbi:MAG: cation:proton antiporter [Candidatus Thermoplasmatota archaeon]|nr:cation:proton antiporter [Candidatus Thermoplasmatota archaeon]